MNSHSASGPEPSDRAAPSALAVQLEALIARIALGDRQAFEALYRATSAKLFGVVCHINRDASQAEEVLQEVYIAVWRLAQGFDARQGLVMTWLSSLARHRAIDSIRRHATQPRTVSGALDDGDAGAFDGVPSEALGPMELLNEATRAHALEDCMGTLSGEQRSCLALAYYQGLSHAEVALHLGTPLGTVKSWVRKSLLILRDCLDRVAGRSGLEKDLS